MLIWALDKDSDGSTKRMKLVNDPHSAPTPTATASSWVKVKWECVGVRTELQEGRSASAYGCCRRVVELGVHCCLGILATIDVTAVDLLLCSTSLCCITPSHCRHRRLHNFYLKNHWDLSLLKLFCFNLIVISLETINRNILITFRSTLSNK